MPWNAKYVIQYMKQKLQEKWIVIGRIPTFFSGSDCQVDKEKIKCIEFELKKQ